MTIIRYAFDRSARTFDENGHLHVEFTNISKAAVNPYYGREIPNADKLGLDANRVYNLLRDPGELAKAVDSFNGLPLLDVHTPVSADNSQRNRIVGTTGTGTMFQAPYLKTPLVVWDGDAISDIESGEKQQLSCGYRYEADMTPGEYEGVSYDGVMRNIRGNHVALVAVGRAGSDVVVQDGLSSVERNELKDEDFAVPGKRKLPIENAKHVKLAWDLIDDTDGLTAEEKATARTRIKAAAKRFDVDTSNWQGAADSAPKSKGSTMTVKQKAALDAVIAKLKPYLATDADMEKVKAAVAEDDDEDEEKKKAEAEKKAADDAEEEAKKRAEADKSKDDDKKAMDAAIAKTAADTEARVVARMHGVAEAQRLVRPVVGDVFGQDTAEGVFKIALDHMGVDTKDVPASGMKPLFQAVAKQKETSPAIGMDSASRKSFAEQFPNAARVRKI